MSWDKYNDRMKIQKVKGDVVKGTQCQVPVAMTTETTEVKGRSHIEVPEEPAIKKRQRRPQIETIMRLM